MGKGMTYVYFLVLLVAASLLLGLENIEGWSSNFSFYIHVDALQK